METFQSFEEVLYRVNENSFEEIALKLFHFQASYNPVYSEYIRHLRIKPGLVDTLEQIPYLPVSFFKNHDIKTGDWQTAATFTSSGTTGMISSKHAVHDVGFYLENAARCFTFFYGDLSGYRFLALLPSYAERGGSSLIAMIEAFIKRGAGGFYHQNKSGLLEAIRKPDHRKTILWGVTYALLDLAESDEPALPAGKPAWPADKLDLSNCIVLETGGMKGRRAEITRAELHQFLGSRFHTPAIHSEYGMTELMSQAYSSGNGIFSCPPWMRILLRDPEDPREVISGRGLSDGQTRRGGINIIDLANIRTCAFIETQDLGRMGQNGSFEVLGRMDNSDVRGCNLLVE